VFSGGARGVDIAAMLAAVDAGGCAVGVLADSLEKLGQRRELRTPIVENELTLISPFHPAAPFNIGNAMRRNRLVYCLADAAVIVASDAESGGTRAGALENLKAQWVPLHVRADGSSGNNDLVRRGGKPMTDQTVNGEEPLSLDGPNLAPQLLLDGEQEEESPEQSAPPAETDIYRLAWPQLEAFLLEPRTAKEVAEMFTLELAQARKWLKRALEEGKVTRASAHYQRIDADAQPQLWDENR
jgi:predicted Rossmann fold nucleotide-binding protein DprA/Smf involved in DNA uptake